MMTIDELHIELKAGFKSQDTQLAAMALTITECRDDIKLLNGRLRAEESWTSRMQGAIAVVTALSLGSLGILLIG